MMAILALAIAVGGLSSARLIAGLAGGDIPEPAMSPAGTLPMLLPDRDVQGRDVRALPRYPGSVRIGYQRQERSQTIVTRVTYALHGGRNAVRSFYVDIFREHGWTVVDLEYAGGTWTFAVERGTRSASVEVAGDAEMVRVRLDVRRALPEPTPEPTPKPEPPAPPPPPPDDDDDDDFDDDDRDDDGGDDSDDGGGDD